MALSPYVFDATPENFRSLVLGNSDKGPVLVHYWSPKAAPCMILMPRLVRLADEYGGKFLLVMLNTDQHNRLAREYSVNSVPTVKFFRHGNVVHTIHGAESDAEFRKVIGRFVAHPADRAHAIGVHVFQRGETEKAYEMLAQAAMADPDNLKIPLDLAKMLMLNGEFTRAENLLKALPPEARSEPDISALLTHLAFIQAAQQAPGIVELEQTIADQPGNLEARYQLSAVKLVADNYAGAMEQLLEITRSDRAFREDIGRRGLLAIFNILGNENELVSRYRSLLINVLN